MKVLFLASPIAHFPKYAYFPQLSAMTLIGNLGRHNGKILEFVFNTTRVFEVLVEGIERFKPDLIAMGPYTFQFKAANLMAKFIKYKYPNLKIVIGGWHASGMVIEGLVFEDFKNFDFIVFGEAEGTLQELCDCIEGGKSEDIEKISGLIFKKGKEFIFNPKRAPLELSKINLPDRLSFLNNEHFKNQKNVFWHLIETSRGCLYDCNYCCSPAIYGKNYRKFSLDRVIEDLKTIRFLNGKRVFISDEHLTFNVENFSMLCKEIMKHKMNTIEFHAETSPLHIVKNPEWVKLAKNAGFRMITVAIENFSPANLSSYNRTWSSFELVSEALEILRKNKLLFHVCLVLGAPDDEEETIRQQFDIVKKLSPASLGPYLLTPFPGTKIKKILKEKGLITSEDFSKYDVMHPVVKTKHLTTEKLYTVWKKEIISYNLYKKNLKKLFKNFITLNDEFFINLTLPTYLYFSRNVLDIEEQYFKGVKKQ